MCTKHRIAPPDLDTAWNATLTISRVILTSVFITFVASCSERPPSSPVPASVTETAESPLTTAITPRATQMTMVTAGSTHTPTLTNVPSPTISPTPPPSGRVITELLNVRKGPGTDYEVIDQLPEVTSFNVIARGCNVGEGSDWLLIAVNAGGQRWISGSPRYVLSYNIDNLACVVPPPTPTPPGTNPNFRADRTAIRPGECTTLRWDVEGIREIYLDDWGTTGHNAQRMCPNQTQTFVITVLERDGREIEWPLTIQVGGTPAPTSTPSPRRNFALVHNGCIGGTSRNIGVVKGQVLDRNGRPIVGARVGIHLDGRWWDSGANPARTNEDGWYEWYLTPGQHVNFVLLRMPNGADADSSSHGFPVDSRGGCFQHVNFIEQ